MRIILGAVVLIMFLGSCTINNSLMLRTYKGYEYDTIPLNPDLEYRISPDDILTMELYTNDGYKLVNMSIGDGSGGMRINQSGGGMSYPVEYDGMVKLPIIGRVLLEKMTIKEAETFLESKYQNFYKKPFVLISVTNKRVIVFPGSGGQAQVIPLANNNTTLIEVLAQAGGVSERGKSKKIRILRRENSERQVFEVDLSTIEGLKYGDMVVQADDIIYVEPTPQIATELLKDLSPFVSLITTVVLLISIATGTL